jgi:hypothetical protein
MTIQFEVDIYSYIYLIWLRSLLQALHFKNLFTDFLIVINDKIQHDLLLCM